MILENCMPCCYSTSPACELRFSFLQIEECNKELLLHSKRLIIFIRIFLVGFHLLSCCTKMDVLFNISDCEVDKTLQTIITLSISWYQVQI